MIGSIPATKNGNTGPIRNPKKCRQRPYKAMDRLIV